MTITSKPNLDNEMIFSVKAEIINSLRVTILKNNNINNVVTVNHNDIVEIRYIDQESSLFKTITGRVSELNYNFINLDCSKDFKSITIKILISDIRDIEVLRSGEIEPLPL